MVLLCLLKSWVCMLPPMTTSCSFRKNKRTYNSSTKLRFSVLHEIFLLAIYPGKVCFTKMHTKKFYFSLIFIPQTVQQRIIFFNAMVAQHMIWWWGDHHPLIIRWYRLGTKPSIPMNLNCGWVWLCIPPTNTNSTANVF